MDQLLSVFRTPLVLGGILPGGLALAVTLASVLTRGFTVWPA